MSKRHMSAQKKSEIGAERISILLNLSTEAVMENHPERAKRYVSLARRIGMKTRTKIPKEFRICKKCLLPMVPGINCRVRLSNHMVCLTCTECNEIYRLPYLKEQRK